MILRFLVVAFFTSYFISISAQSDKHYLISSNETLAALGNPKVIDGNLDIKGISLFEGLSNIEVILGNLTIEQLRLEDYNSYLRMPSLKKISGNLIIRNVNAPASVFLDSLREVLSIEISNNDSLEFVSLPSLENVPGHLSVKENNVIGNLSLSTVSNLKMTYLEIENNPNLFAFFPPNIEEIDSIEIINNPELHMLGWTSLRIINGHIDINNSVAQGVSQFPKLEIVGNFIRLKNIPLGAFIKFESLRSIGTANSESGNGFIVSEIDELYSIELPELTEINGVLGIMCTKTNQYATVKMPKLEHVNSLKIVNNDHFEDLNFLLSIKTITESIIIEDNNKLSSCNLPFICSLSDEVFANKLTIANNLNCCTDLRSLKDDCEEKCCPDSTTFIFDRCDIFIYKTESGECYEINIDTKGKPLLKKVNCPD